MNYIYTHGIKSTVLEHSYNAEIPDNIRILPLSTYVKFLIAVQPTVATELRRADYDAAIITRGFARTSLIIVCIWRIRDRSRWVGGGGGIGRDIGGKTSPGSSRYDEKFVCVRNAAISLDLIIYRRSSRNYRPADIVDIYQGSRQRADNVPPRNLVCINGHAGF